MPFLELQSQLAWPEKEELEALLSRLSAVVASGLGKPESIVMVSVHQAKSMRFAGTLEPCCYAALRGIGEVGSSAMNGICQAVSGELEASLSIPASRVFIVFDEVRRTHWGVGGRMLE